MFTLHAVLYTKRDVHCRRTTVVLGNLFVTAATNTVYKLFSRRRLKYTQRFVWNERVTVYTRVWYIVLLLSTTTTTTNFTVVKNVRRAIYAKHRIFQRLTVYIVIVTQVSLFYIIMVWYICNAVRVQWQT